MKLKSPGLLLLSLFWFILQPCQGQNSKLNQIKTLFEQAIYLEESGNLNGAIETHKKILSLDSTVTPSVNTIAGIYGKLEDFSSEVTWARKAIAMDPDYYNAYINLANAQTSIGNITEASKTLYAAIKIDADNPLAYYTLGLLSEALRDLNAAKIQYRRAIEVDPEFEAGHFNLATVHANLGEFELAVTHLEKVLSLNPNARDAREMMEMVLADMGEKVSQESTIESSYVKIVQLSPDSGSEINENSQITARLAYAIDDNQKSEYGYSLSVKFASQKSGSVFSSGAGSKVTLQDKKGEVVIEYGLKEIWSKDKLKHPVEVFFFLHNHTSAVRSRVIASTDGIVYSE